MAKNRKRPTYQLHRKSGQARTYIDGTDYYLGPHGSPESYQQFDDLVAKWLSTGQVGSYQARVDDLAILFTEHADAYYRKPTGKPTGEASNIRQALRPLIAKFGTSLARDFSPKRFKDYREKLIADGICRTSINRHAARIRGMFRWAAENDHVPVTVWQSLTAVKALAAGRTQAAESEPVKPVPQEHVDQRCRELTWQ